MSVEVVNHMPKPVHDPFIPYPAIITRRIQETNTLFTLSLEFEDKTLHEQYEFIPGQFNMVYLHGIGEIAISIMSDPVEQHSYDHTIRAVGRVSKGLMALKTGEHVALRGPFGRGWPLMLARDKDVIILTGGLGCAPVISVINYIMRRRLHYGKIMILQGVKHSDDFIYQQHYAHWQQQPNTEVLIAADQSGPSWPWMTGRITNMLDELSFNPQHTIAMLCGPEVMMRVAIEALSKKGMSDDDMYLSMERSMHCATGHCGHCQFGGKFVCKDGPVFSFSQICDLFYVSGF